jgi:heme O synthase-like polyprenyltransferase
MIGLRFRVRELHLTTERTESLIRLGARKNRLPRAITAIALGKPRIVALVGFTTLAGYVAAGGSATHNPLHGALLIIC